MQNYSELYNYKTGEKAVEKGATEQTLNVFLLTDAYQKQNSCEKLLQGCVGTALSLKIRMIRSRAVVVSRKRDSRKLSLKQISLTPKATKMLHSAHLACI